MQPFHVFRRVLWRMIRHRTRKFVVLICLHHGILTVFICRWKVLEESTFENSGRYGHVGLTYLQKSGKMDEMFIFGGYDGETINDPLVFQPYPCDAYSVNEHLCIG